MIARSVLLYAREITLTRLQAGYEASLRLRAASTLAARGWVFASSIGQAGMQALLLTDVSRASLAVNFGQQFAVSAVLLGVQLALALLLSPLLALVAFAIIALGLIVGGRWARRGSISGIAFVEQSEQSTDSGFRLHLGLKAALAQGSVPQFLDEYAATLSRTQCEAVSFSRDLNVSRQLAALAAALAAALLLFVGLRILQLPFPVLIASLALFARMVAPAQAVQQAAHQILAYGQSFGAIERRLGKLGPAVPKTAPAEPLKWQEVRLEQVAFRHPSGRGLGPLSLTLGRGDWVGVGGPSGAGKTTLLDLVANLLAPTEGRLLIDGGTLGPDEVQRWRAALAYVGQDGIVFKDSVRGNLNAGAVAAPDERLWEVLEVVGLAERIRALPCGLDQEVGDRGSQLSGGERQRLVLARALLRQPSLLIMDEATAGLDVQSEAVLLERLRKLNPRPAAFVVAHRERTLHHCDSVIEIQDEGGKR
jgi:ATP-binding cassette subfamily C protein